MTTNPFSVYPETSLQTVVAEMAESKIGSTVIINYDRHVLGIFTTTDAMKVLSKMLEDDGVGNYKTIKISEYLFGQQRGIA